MGVVKELRFFFFFLETAKEKLRRLAQFLTAGSLSLASTQLPSPPFWDVTVYGTRWQV